MNDRNQAPYRPYSSRPDGQVNIRNVSQIGVQDIEQEPMKYVALALVHLRKSVQDLVIMIEDRSRSVDAYQPQEYLAGSSSSNIELQPQWEAGETITSIIITGPAGAVTLQLGDRFWPLTIPASGVIVIAPIKLYLDRSDRRILSFSTPGAYSLELMGYGDTRGNVPS